MTLNGWISKNLEIWHSPVLVFTEEGEEKQTLGSDRNHSKTLAQSYTHMHDNGDTSKMYI